MTKPNRPAARRALVLALMACAALGAAPQASAQVGKKHNSNAPVNYAADRIEMQDRDNRVVLTGNVDITQDDMRLRADRVTVNYTNTPVAKTAAATPAKPGATSAAASPNGSLKIQRMIANGSVFVTQQTAQGLQTARGDAAVYDLVQRIITMAGNVTLNRGNGDVLNGGRLVMNLDTGVSNVDGRSTAAAGSSTASKGGRVSGTFSVDQKPAAAKPAPAGTKGK